MVFFYSSSYNNSTVVFYFYLLYLIIIVGFILSINHGDSGSIPEVQGIFYFNILKHCIFYKYKLIKIYNYYYLKQNVDIFKAKKVKVLLLPFVNK